MKKSTKQKEASEKNENNKTIENINNTTEKLKWIIAHDLSLFVSRLFRRLNVPSSKKTRASKVSTNLVHSELGDAQRTVEDPR